MMRAREFLSLHAMAHINTAYAQSSFLKVKKSCSQLLPPQKIALLPGNLCKNREKVHTSFQAFIHETCNEMSLVGEVRMRIHGQNVRAQTDHRTINTPLRPDALHIRYVSRVKWCM